MTIADLKALIERAEMEGASDETPVLWVGQPNYPLVSEIHYRAAVVFGGDQDEACPECDGDGCRACLGTGGTVVDPDDGPTHVLLCEGAQRPNPYLGQAEVRTLEELNWTR